MNRRPFFIGLIVLVVLLAALFTWRATTSTSASACDSTPSATLVASPDIAPAIEGTAKSMAEEGWCARVTVEVQEPDLVFGELVVDTSGAADLWVPDSDVWVEQLAAEGVSSDILMPVLATSPVVLASGPSAKAPKSWFSALSSDQITMLDPQQQSASALALVAPRAERETSGVSAQEINARLVPVAQKYGERAGDTTPVVDVLAAVTTTTKRLVPVTEQAWLQARRTNQKLHAVVPETGTLLQRYPLIGLPDRSTRANAAISVLLDYLARPQSDEVLGKHGFRPGSGEPLPGDVGLGKVPELARPAATEIGADLKRWDVLTVPSSLLAVVDASGSMDFRAGDSTRMELAMAAAGTALQTFGDNARIGLWLFSIDQGRDTDYRELVPLRRLDAKVEGGTQREALESWLVRALNLTQGGTGLYDTTLAAVRSAREDYDPGYFNAVVLITDGANDDPGSIELPALLKKLRDEADPKRPVRIIAIGISANADMDALEQIAEATNGSAYEALDPRDILDVISKALLAR